LATAIKKKEQEWFKEGLMEGRNEGIALGEEKGRIEERRETARRMKQEQVSIDIIMRVTGLSREEIEEL
ncbi:MAG: hypothetical protein N2509_07865, partial [Treponemataceae bacterium]|nr:hypothetical protein [Treponemataceae bacterium]